MKNYNYIKIILILINPANSIAEVFIGSSINLHQSSVSLSKINNITNQSSTIISSSVKTQNSIYSLNKIASLVGGSFHLNPNYNGPLLDALEFIKGADTKLYDYLADTITLIKQYLGSLNYFPQDFDEKTQESLNALMQSNLESIVNNALDVFFANTNSAFQTHLSSELAQSKYKEKCEEIYQKTLIILEESDLKENEDYLTSLEGIFNQLNDFMIYHAEDFVEEFVENFENNQSVANQITDFENIFQERYEDLIKITNETLKIDEFNSIKEPESKISPSLSLLTGFAFNVGNFGFITEVGLDINSLKFGDSESKEIEIRSLYHFYLAQKVGYKFTEKTLTYITLGIGMQDYKATYEGKLINIDNEKNLTTLILGAGYEYKIKKTISLFAEFNNIIPLSKMTLESSNTEFGTINFKQNQFKLGVRYYF